MSESPATTIDVEVANHGTLFTFELLTSAARAWWNENVGESTAVEHRYAYDIAQGMLDDGLVIQ